MVKHEIDDDSTDGHVKPHRIGPAGARAVGLKPSAKRARKGQYNKWHHCGGENCVRNQDREIYRARIAVPLEPNAADVCVVVQVRDQEKRRGHDRSQHDSLVSGLPLSPYQDNAGQDQNGAGPVKDSVDDREDRVVVHTTIVAITLPAWYFAGSP